MVLFMYLRRKVVGKETEKVAYTIHIITETTIPKVVLIHIGLSVNEKQYDLSLTQDVA